MSERFIENTLHFARGQTYDRIRILVSVDESSDATLDLCRKHGREDPRLEVFEQPRRLGWAENVNFLLERVETPFFFLYFHDDILLPQYTQVLLEHLKQRPDAMSVHCDVRRFGASDVSVGRSYEGSAAYRLMVFLVAPSRGSPLRSLTRSAALPGLHLPTDALAGLWANEPYLMRLLAAGPALHVDQTLYLRWDRRAGGVTDGWRTLRPEAKLAAHRANVATALTIIDETRPTPSEREALVFCLFAHMVPRLRDLERQTGVPLFTDPADLHPAFADMRPPDSLGDFGPDIENWARSRYRNAVQDDNGR